MEWYPDGSSLDVSQSYRMVDEVRFPDLNPHAVLGEVDVPQTVASYLTSSRCEVDATACGTPTPPRYTQR